MSSPFPGMDPYLEAAWGDVQASLAVYARNQLRKQLPAGLVARVHTRIAIDVDDPTDDEVTNYFPDVLVVGKRGKKTTPAHAAIATEPLVLTRRSEPETLRSVRITTTDGAKLVTAIEFLSPSNKIGRTGRDDFREKQKTVLASGASVVEIDLIRAGRHVLSCRLTDIPRRFRGGYKAVVVRGWKREQAEFYPLPIRAKLPTIRVPLRKGDPDATLDLQQLIATAYEDGGHDAIDYRGRLEPDLPPDDRAWAAELLKAAGKR